MKSCGRLPRISPGGNSTADRSEGEQSDLHFWRDSTGHEIDLLLDLGPILTLIEIKSEMTVDSNLFEGLGTTRIDTGSALRLAPDGTHTGLPALSRRSWHASPRPSKPRDSHWRPSLTTWATGSMPASIRIVISSWKEPSTPRCIGCSESGSGPPRSVQADLRLADQHDERRLDQACRYRESQIHAEPRNLAHPSMSTPARHTRRSAGITRAW